MERKTKELSGFERYLTLWVLLCIGGGIILGKAAPELSVKLASFSIYEVTIPLAE
jgi:ACR3 family arsenite transporter